MIDRINLILKAKNITARQFAEEIGIQPSGMSHILGGRNRPSLDFVMKVINRYPEIDIKWLTLGEGEMYAPSQVPVPAIQTPVEKPAAPVAPVDSTASETTMPQTQTSPKPYSPMELDLFSMAEDPSPIKVDPKPVEINEPDPIPVITKPEPSVEPPKPQPNENRVNDLPKEMTEENQNLVKKKIVKVVILYSDHSFSEYYPE